MYYPDYFTADDIMEFEYEYNRHLDLQDPESEVSVNARINEIVEEEREMSMSDLVIDIQNDILAGVLSFAEIAQKHEVPSSWVNEAWDLLCEQEAEAEQYAGYHDELERDHDEAYEPDYGDSWYDDQYELEADYI
jgi:hypothetical protein